MIGSSCTTYYYQTDNKKFNSIPPCASHSLLPKTLAAHDLKCISHVTFFTSNVHHPAYIAAAPSEMHQCYIQKKDE